MIFAVPLKDLRPLPGTPDLLALSPENQLLRLRELFSFLPPDTHIEIKDGVAIISSPDAKPTDENESARLREKASKRAAQGEYGKAKAIYQRVLELTPSAVAPRRDLAMICYELGDYEDAKSHLVDALRLDPSDAWSYVILGNLYIRAEDDKKTAATFYKRALALKPNDPWALNGLAAATAELGDLTGALALFDQAISTEPRFANAHFGKSVALAKAENFRGAALALEALFATGERQDVRSDPIFKQAREQYFRLENIIANNRLSESFKAVEDLKARAAGESGFPIRVEEGALDAKIAGSVQMAWKHNRDFHRLILREGNTPDILKHHISAHELHHVLMEAAARKAGTNRWFATSAASREVAIRSLRRDIERLEKKGYTSDKVVDLILNIVSGACGFLFNCPLDMIIETTIRREIPALREAQFCGVFSLAQDARNATFHPEIRQLTPAPILKINDTLNGAYALFADELFEGATAFADAYRSLSTMQQSSEFYDLWKDLSANSSPGSEYAIVDAFAEKLRIRDWYEWKADPGVHDVSEPAPKEGTTNPELLREKYPAAVWFLLDALKRYASMDLEEIQAISLEIAMVGRTGLDYASAEKKYTLRTIPAASFSGLHLMCLMHAGLKRIAPDVDSGMDLNEPFLQALELFNAEHGKE